MELSPFSLCALIAIISLLFYIVKNHLEYWRKRGIPYDEPHILLGSFKGYRSTVAPFEVFTKIYKRFKGTGPFAGFFMYTIPSALVTDLDLIKNILIKDFNKFDERGLPYNERDEPISANLFHLNGPQWKPLRAKLTPTFTSGKMKFMLPTIIKIGEEFMTTLQNESNKNSDINVGDLLSRFTTDVIGTCAYGIDCNSLKNPKCEFAENRKTILNYSPHPIQSFLSRAFPESVKFFRFKQYPKYLSEFYSRVVHETLDLREKNNIRRNDFMDLLIDLKNKKSIRTEDGEELKALSMNEIIAMCFSFFVGGFETSSTAMGFALYELAQHRDIQDKLRMEINSIFQKYDGEISYEGLKEMVYMDKIINETLRKYPPIAFLRRRAKVDYPTDNPKYVIPKGASALIPIFSIQNDPDIFPNPDIFDPERFSPEEISKRHPMTWLSFGEGPRNCIGLRFGLMQVRVGLTMLIKNFEFAVCKDTPIPMKFSKIAFMIASEKPIVLKVSKL